MNLETIYGILTTLSTLAVGALAIYFNASKKAQAKAKEVQEVIADLMAKTVIFIKEAEENYVDSTKAGGVKFKEVVDRLYALVPVSLKAIITRTMIEEIVQSTFDEIEAYVKTQLDEAVDSIEVNSDKQ